MQSNVYVDKDISCIEFDLQCNSSSMFIQFPLARYQPLAAIVF